MDIFGTGSVTEGRITLNHYITLNDAETNNCYMISEAINEICRINQVKIYVHLHAIT